MASVHFYLKGSWSKQRITEAEKTNPKVLQDYLNSKLQITWTVSTAGKRLQVYTAKRIEPKFWDSEKERANTKVYKTHGVILNDLLGQLQTAGEQLANENENNGKYTTLEDLRKLIPQKKLHEQVIEAKIDIEERIKTFLVDHKTKKGFPLRLNTKKKYKSIQNLLIDFAKTNRISLSLDNMNIEFLSAFQTYLNGLQDDDEMSDSTKEKYIAGLKTFIGFYQKKKLIPYYDLSEVVAQSTEGEIYVLPLQRLIELQNKKFKTNRLNTVRDQFCFMCWTGQRFGDYKAMRKEDFATNEFDKKVWRLSQEKIAHGNLLSIPIIEYADEILKRYKGGSLPIPEITNQKFNLALKDMGREAKFNFEVKRIKYYNGKARIETLPFYEVLTAHVARKTYITNSLILGVPERVVKEISGHKDERSFRRYIKLADSYKSAVVQEAYSKKNVERVLKLIGDKEKFTDL